ncbi:MAG: GGDEF domain-containing protein [Cocleimonas sp.]|nr:GGDEF domain-containing protein [Cocleimonas sp.]
MITIKNEEALFFQYLDFLPTPALIGQEDKCNKRAKILFVNKAFINTIGYKVTDIPDHLSFISRAYPDINYRHEVMMSWLNRMSQLTSRKTSIIQLCSKVLCKDQQYRWFDIRTELKSTIGKGVVIVLFNNVDKAKNEALQYAKLSRTDPLTKLANRRYIQQLLKQETLNYQQDYNPFSLVMADIDFFKTINDSFGHSCGDYVIEMVAKIINRSTRKIDVAARWGGEEYLLLLPKTNTTEARIVVKKIMKRIHEYAFEWEGERFNVSLTYGITEYRMTEECQETIKRADGYLYQGKSKGRDCIVSDSLIEVWGE